MTRFALLFAALVLRATEVRNVVGNVTCLTTDHGRRTPTIEYAS